MTTTDWILIVGIGLSVWIIRAKLDEIVDLLKSIKDMQDQTYDHIERIRYDVGPQYKPKYDV